MLAHYGVEVGESLVMDARNEPFPVQVQRSVAGMTVLEVQQIPYPFFVDVRRDSMATESPIVANLRPSRCNGPHQWKWTRRRTRAAKSSHCSNPPAAPGCELRQTCSRT